MKSANSTECLVRQGSGVGGVVLGGVGPDHKRVKRLVRLPSWITQQRKPTAIAASKSTVAQSKTVLEVVVVAAPMALTIPAAAAAARVFF